jgi:hypothetical protein
MFYQIDTKSHTISITSVTITFCTEHTEVPYRIAKLSSYANTADVTSDHNPHPTLMALHLTVGSAVIPVIPFGDESSLVLSQ